MRISKYLSMTKLIHEHCELPSVAEGAFEEPKMLVFVQFIFNSFEGEASAKNSIFLVNFSKVPKNLLISFYRSHFFVELVCRALASVCEAQLRLCINYCF